MEKYLKALLEEQGQPVPRTHILRDLQNLLLPHVPSLRSFSRGLKFLTCFAVGTRYPGDDATKRQAVAALITSGSPAFARGATLALRKRMLRIPARTTANPLA